MHSRSMLSVLTRLLVATLLLLGLAACGGDPDPVDSSDTSTSPDAADTTDPSDATSSPDGQGDDAGLDTHADTDAAPDATGECVDDETRCDGLGRIERCVSGTWQVETTCALACEAGQCTDAAANCAADELRCVGDTLQRCNAHGSAWLHSTVCDDRCSAGLCTGSCTPGEFRCNADRRESCDADGSGWSSEETCSLGCRQTVCVEDKLEIPGSVVELSGTHVYENCVDISLAGELKVPAGETLVIEARCLTMSESAKITVGAGSILRVRVTETADIDGTVSGGTEAYLEARDTLRLAGSISSGRTILRADDLAIEAGGATSGSQLNAALYGSVFTNDGAHSGIVSVMPPAEVDSTTHPSGTTWNLAGDHVVVTWPRPFATAQGYYVATGDIVPGPSNAEFRSTESIAIPLSQFESGENRVRIVSVNADSDVGTFFAELALDFNARGPVITSSSHPNESAWGGSDDVYLNWSDPDGLPDGAFVGYYYAWDRQADTVPTMNNGTFNDGDSLLLSDQEAGIWFFHIAGVDRLGRISTVSRRMVRIGDEPQMGNVAGTVTDAATGEPIEGATVLLNGGLLRTYSDSSGDYTFASAVPAATHAYRVTARALGYASKEAQVNIGAGDAETEHFALDADPNSTARPVELGWETHLSAIDLNSPSVAMGPGRRFIWSPGNSRDVNEQVTIATTSGQEIHSDSTMGEYYTGRRMEVGWNGQHFYAIDIYKCNDNGSLNYGHGWSCLQMRSWDPEGTVIGGWLKWRNSGQTGAASAAFNGTTYGTFFVSYGRLYSREIAADITFADGGTPTAHSLLSSHGDTRQRATSRAVWDGSGYATAWNIERSSSDSTPALFFGRWDRDLNTLLSPTEIDSVRSSSEIGLVWDGTTYQLLYARPSTNSHEFALQAVHPDGSQGTSTSIATDPGNLLNAQLSFDGRYLLLAWEDATTGTVHLEVRRPDNHTLIDSLEFPGSNPVVSINETSGEGVVLYERGGAAYVRTLSVY